MNETKKPNNDYAVKMAKWVIKWRLLVLAGTSIAALAAGYGGQFIIFNNDYHVFFSDENPQLNAYDALQDKYTKTENVFIVIEPKDGNVFTNETLTAIEELTEQSWQTPYSIRVDAITNYQHTRSVGDNLYVEDLVSDPKNQGKQELEEIKKIALNEPVLLNRLINEDGSITGVNITVQLPDTVLSPEANVAEFVRKMVSDLEEKYPNIKTYLSGVVMLNMAFTEAMKTDISSLIPLMFLVILIVIFITTRSISATFAALFVLVFSIMTAMGLAGWLGIELSSVSGQVPTMVLTLAVADSIHILITMIQNMRKGLAKREAIVESLRINLLPVIITSVTTAIGFLTMNFSDAPPFKDLGNIVAMGMIAALFFSVLTLPAIMAILPVKVKPTVAKQGSRTILIDKFGEFVIKNNKKLLWASTLTVFIIAAFAFKNELNTRFINFFDKSIPFRADTDFIIENLTGIYTLEYSLGTDENNGISNPEYLKKLEEFKQWFEGQEHVLHVNSFSEVMSRVNKSMHGDSLEYFRVPDNRQEAAQYLLLYEMSLPYGLDLNNQINIDKSESRFVVTIGDISANEMIELTERGEQWLKDNAPPEMFSVGMSVAMMFANLTNRQIYGMIKGSLVGILLISLVLIFALRSFKFGMLSLLPNILPILAGFGIWAFMNGEINVALTSIFGMVLGIVVDDTTHFLSKYLRARREQNKGSADAVRYAFSTVGNALVVTTIVLVAGFTVLAQSKFILNSDMGKLTSIIIFLALVIVLIMIPSILLIGHKELVSGEGISDNKKE